MGLHLRGLSLANTANFLGVSKRSVAGWWRLYRQTGEVMPKEKRGPKRQTTARADRLLKRLAKRHRFATARELLQYCQQRVSIWTVYRCLRESGFRHR